MILWYFMSFVLVLLSLTESGEGKTLDEYLNRCLHGRHHKQKPGPEDSLHKQCTPWKNRACCQENVTKVVHTGTLYNFNLHHCKQLSPPCLQHFNQDLCFYECTPNGGPWIHKESKMKIRKERYFEIPLCEDTCQEWWNSCKDDETCSENWARAFNWTTGTNTCIHGTKCRKFSEVFKTATNFCQKVWDHSWKVVPKQPCFTFWFDENGRNPNDKVAYQKALELTSGSSYLKSYSYFLSILLLTYL